MFKRDYALIRYQKNHTHLLLFLFKFFRISTFGYKLQCRLYFYWCTGMTGRCFCNPLKWNTFDIFILLIEKINTRVLLYFDVSVMFPRCMTISSDFNFFYINHFDEYTFILHFLWRDLDVFTKLVTFTNPMKGIRKWPYSRNSNIN